MKQEQPQPSKVEITYTPLEGCTLKAVRLSQEIQHCYEIPVRVQEREDGVFEIRVNGMSIYRGEGTCDTQENHEAIFLRLDQIQRRLRSLPVPREEREEEKDESYQSWMRALCSGE